MDKLSKKYGEAFLKNPDEKDERYKQLQKDYDELSAIEQKKETLRLKEFIKAHPGSFSAIYLLDQYSRNLDISEVKSLYAMLSPTYKNTPTGKNIIASIEARNNTAVGKQAPDFTQSDTSGHEVKLSDFNGKYVLLDFWASWCVPCRAESPHLLKVFNQYKDKGFTVLGVSLDQPNKKEAWLSAIHKDGLLWTQVSDLKGWDNAAAKQYDISAIPANILIDPNGKIVAKNLQGEDLENKLNEVLK